MNTLRLLFLVALLTTAWLFPLSLAERTAVLCLGVIALRDSTRLREWLIGLGLAALLTLTAWTATH